MSKGFGFCSAVLAIALMAGTCLGLSVTVTYTDGRPSEQIQVQQQDGTYYISVSEISRLLGLDKTVDLEAGKATLRHDDTFVEIPAGGTVWIKDGQTLGVEEASYIEGKEVFIGLGSVEDVLAPALGKSVHWDAHDARLLVGLPAPNIIDIDVRTARERVSATIKTIGLLGYELFPAVDDKVEILIKGGAFSKRLGFESQGGLVRSIEARQEQRGARIVVNLGPGHPYYKVFPRQNPDGIVIYVWRRTAADIPEPEFQPPKHIAWSDRFSDERLKLDLIVIDPGHGGENYGSIGPTGYTEKEFNLELAERLKQQLESKGIEVILTRNDDVFVDLETRTELANSVAADLFISIHANGFRNTEARGFEVYFQSPALEDDARVVAAMENAGADVIPMASRKPGDDVAFILWDTAQNEFVVESSHLAQLVNEELMKRLNIPNRGVKQANFVVLTGVYLPAVLIETAFLTNPKEEQLLRDKAFQETVAQGIVEAILRFKASYGR